MIQKYGFSFYQSYVFAFEGLMLTEHRVHNGDDSMSQFYRHRYESAASYYLGATKFSSRFHADIFRYACSYVGLINHNLTHCEWGDLSESDRKKFIIGAEHFDSEIKKLFENDFRKFPDMTLMRA